MMEVLLLNIRMKIGTMNMFLVNNFILKVDIPCYLKLNKMVLHIIFSLVAFHLKRYKLEFLLNLLLPLDGLVIIKYINMVFVIIILIYMVIIVLNSLLMTYYI